MRMNYRPLLLTGAWLAAFGVSGFALAQNNQADDKPVDKAKASYVLGWDMASQLPDLVREELDADKMAEAVRARIAGEDMGMGLDQAQAQDISARFMTQIQAKAQRELQAEADKNAKDGAAFLAKNKKAKGVKTTDSGLQYKVVKEGKGKKPGKDDIVQIEYTGTFIDGEEFDASRHHPDPADGTSMPLPVKGVIPGFAEGLQLMREGSEYTFWIPADLAYGEQPGNGFPPNATISFDVKLEAVKADEDAK